MTKNIVICCDGTGNEVEENLSNVLKLYRTLKKDNEQVVFYDPGIGTLGKKGVGGGSNKGRKVSLGSLAVPGWTPTSWTLTFHELPVPDVPAFDVVNALTHNVLAHTRSPRSLLTRCFEVLKPGGYLFLDEKDVLLPARYKTLSVFDTGRAHLYHLTVDTTARYLRSVGFELIECEIDGRRVSDFRHIRAVTQKPEGGAAPLRPDRAIVDGASAPEIRRRLRWLERTWGLRRSSVVARRKAGRLLARARTVGSAG